MIDQAELEGCVEALYQIASCDEDEVLSPVTLARRVLGPGSVRLVRGLVAAGSLATVAGQRRIAVRHGLPKHRERHVIGHELGHWILEREGYEGEDLEAACDYIGAGIMTRRRPFARALRRGTSFADLADLFGASETLVALRGAEVTGQPRAVVTPHAVHVRGQLDFVWPPERALRQIANAHASPGVVKVRLRDDPRRVVLDPAATG